MEKTLVIAPGEQRRRIVFVSPSLGGGGAEMQLLRVVNHLDRAKFQSKVVVARGGGAYERHLAPGVESVALLPRWVKSSTASMLAAVLPLRALMRRERPDVVVALLPHACGLCNLALRGMLNPPRLVAGVQNNVTRDLAGAANPVMSYLNREALRFYRRADCVIALSLGVARDLGRSDPELAPKITTIYNAGVDERVRRLAAEPLDEPRPADGALIVACGRLTAQKDYPTLLQAFAGLSQKQRAHLWILGRGPDEGALRELAEGLGIADRVRFLGFQENPYRYMAAADVFVLSSKWEGFGNVVVEAMAAGTAVVSTRCDFGPPEIIEDGRTGLLCEVGDDRGLAAQIDRVLDDTELRARLEQAGRERAEDFDAPRIAAAYGDVIEAI